MKTFTQQAIPKPRIALYGGAFDPVHRAHLEVARAACWQAALEQVIFIPAAHSPLKAQGPRAANVERLAMLELALADEAAFSVDDSELRRGGVSYTINTLDAYRRRLPAAELFWILGGDQLAQLDRWHAIDRLVQRVSFLVLARPGHALSAPAIAGLDWSRIDAPLMSESSTLVRERISRGEPLQGLVPPAVEAFIQQKGLYN